MHYDKLIELLGKEASELLEFNSPKISKDRLTLPGSHFVDEVFFHSDRKPKVIENLKRMFNTGRLGGSGYLSILPVDQGVEHSAGYSFAPNPDYFDPENIMTLATEGGCSAVASTYGVLSLSSKKYAEKIPFILKLNHNELLSYPNTHDQRFFTTVKQAADMGAAGVGATIYFGSAESRRQIEEVRDAFAQAHELGLFTILWCYPRNEAWQTAEYNYEQAADVTGQAIHLGASLGADLVKQKYPTGNFAFRNFDCCKWSEEMYEELTSDHPIDRVRYQVLNAYAGKIGLVNSGGASGKSDLADAVRLAVINKRAGGIGLIMGRKAFQKPLKEGVGLLHSVQDVYLEENITIA